MKPLDPFKNRYWTRQGRYDGQLGVYRDCRRKASVSRLRRPLIVILLVCLGLYLICCHHVWAFSALVPSFSGRI